MVGWTTTGVEGEGTVEVLQHMRAGDMSELFREHVGPLAGLTGEELASLDQTIIRAYMLLASSK